MAAQDEDDELMVDKDDNEVQPGGEADDNIVEPDEIDVDSQDVQKRDDEDIVNQEIEIEDRFLELVNAFEDGGLPFDHNGDTHPDNDIGLQHNDMPLPLAIEGPAVDQDVSNHGDILVSIPTGVVEGVEASFTPTSSVQLLGNAASKAMLDPISSDNILEKKNRKKRDAKTISPDSCMPKILLHKISEGQVFQSK